MKKVAFIVYGLSFCAASVFGVKPPLSAEGRHSSEKFTIVTPDEYRQMDRDVRSALKSYSREMKVSQKLSDDTTESVEDTEARLLAMKKYLSSEKFENQKEMAKEKAKVNAELARIEEVKKSHAVVRRDLQYTEDKSTWQNKNLALAAEKQNLEERNSEAEEADKATFNVISQECTALSKGGGFVSQSFASAFSAEKVNGIGCSLDLTPAQKVAKIADQFIRGIGIMAKAVDAEVKSLKEHISSQSEELSDAKSQLSEMKEQMSQRDKELSELKEKLASLESQSTQPPKSPVMPEEKIVELVKQHLMEQTSKNVSAPVVVNDMFAGSTYTNEELADKYTYNGPSTEQEEAREALFSHNDIGFEVSGTFCNNRLDVTKPLKIEDAYGYGIKFVPSKGTAETRFGISIGTLAQAEKVEVDSNLAILRLPESNGIIFSEGYVFYGKLSSDGLTPGNIGYIIYTDGKVIASPEGNTNRNWWMKK